MKLLLVLLFFSLLLPWPQTSAASWGRETVL